MWCQEPQPLFWTTKWLCKQNPCRHWRHQSASITFPAYATQLQRTVAGRQTWTLRKQLLFCSFLLPVTKLSFNWKEISSFLPSDPERSTAGYCLKFLCESQWQFVHRMVSRDNFYFRILKIKTFMFSYSWSLWFALRFVRKGNQSHCFSGIMVFSSLLAESHKIAKTRTTPALLLELVVPRGRPHASSSTLLLPNAFEAF